MSPGQALSGMVFSMLVVFFLASNAFSAELKNEKNPYWGTVSSKTAKILTGGCGADPYKLLLSKYTPGTQSAREGQLGITKLNSDFACRLSKFIARFPSICIKSAYRSTETQTILWKQALTKYGSAEKARKWVAPPGSSMHNKGLAADLCNVPDNARSSANSDGLTFRMGHEPWHIEPNGAVSGRSPDGNSAASPSAPLSNRAREALGLNSQPSPQQQPPPPMQQQALPQAQQPTQYFPSQTPTQTSGGGTGSSGQSPVSALSPTSQDYLGVTSSAQPQTSVGDQLLQMAYGNPSPTQPQNTGTTVPLFINGNDTGTLQPAPVSQATNTATQQLGPIGTLQPAQTFTSSDLAYTPPIPTHYQEAPTGIFRVLETMKQTLLRALEILRPMGIRSALQGDTHLDEYVE